jgi:hypothetical protein
MLIRAVSLGGAHGHPAPEGLLGALALIVFVVCIGGVMAPLLGVGLARSSWGLAARRRRHRRSGTAEAEERARALMSELCPHGWRAQITVFSAADSDDHRPLTPDGRRALVALDWTELSADGGRPVVMRRVWARTVAEALEAMVADRRTDETLEQIERGAVADGALWPDG